MLIGFNAPTAGPLSAADNLTKIVVGGEAMGFDYATFSDHVVIPTAIAAEYPYSASGEFPSGAIGERHEQLTEIAWLMSTISDRSKGDGPAVHAPCAGSRFPWTARQRAAQRH